MSYLQILSLFTLSTKLNEVLVRVLVQVRNTQSQNKSKDIWLFIIRFDS